MGKNLIGMKFKISYKILLYVKVNINEIVSIKIIYFYDIYSKFINKNNNELLFIIKLEIKYNKIYYLK